MYLIVAASAEFGLEAAILFEKAIDSEMFCSILRDLKKFGENFVLFGDNASYHKSHYTRKKYAAFKTSMIFNIVATPLLNPCETVIL